MDGFKEFSGWSLRGRPGALVRSSRSECWLKLVKSQTLVECVTP